jgi:hypothetical protein
VLASNSAPYRRRDVAALASILAHEQWHIENSIAETPAYRAQLEVAERLHARGLWLDRALLKRLRVWAAEQ